MKTRYNILIIIGVVVVLSVSAIVVAEIYRGQIEWKEKVGGLKVIPPQEFPSCDIGIFVTDTVKCYTSESPPCTLPAIEQNDMCIVKKIDICEKENVLKDGQCIPNNGNFRVDDPTFTAKKPQTLYDISGVKQIYKIGEPISFTETVQGYGNPCISSHYEILDGNTLETVWQYKIVYPCPFTKDPQQFKTITTVPNDDISAPILHQTGQYILRSHHSYSDGYEAVIFSVVDESIGEKK